MTPFENRQLKNPKDHQVMIDNGFVVESTRNVDIARYTCKDVVLSSGGQIILDLPRSAKVQDGSELLRLVYEHAYFNGREQGKNDAIVKMVKHISSVILS